MHLSVVNKSILLPNRNDYEFFNRPGDRIYACIAPYIVSNSTRKTYIGSIISRGCLNVILVMQSDIVAAYCVCHDCSKGIRRAVINHIVRSDRAVMAQIFENPARNRKFSCNNLPFERNVLSSHHGIVEIGNGHRFGSVNSR